MTDQLPQSSPVASGCAEPQPGMAQCCVTKKWFPEDEVVIFQGQLVSAEGKQILLDRLRTGAGEPGALARPGVFRRFVCISVDWLIILLLWFLLIAVFAIWVVVPFHVFRGNRVGALVSYSFFAGVSLAYFLILHGDVEKSVGKMLGQMRVVRLDGSRASWKTIVLRSALYPGTVLISGMACLLAGLAGEISHNLMLELVAVAFVIWMLADALTALFDTRMQRSLHDRICGTRVILDRG